MNQEGRRFLPLALVNSLQSLCRTRKQRISPWPEKGELQVHVRGAVPSLTGHEARSCLSRGLMSPDCVRVHTWEEGKRAWSVRQVHPIHRALDEASLQLRLALPGLTSRLWLNWAPSTGPVSSVRGSAPQIYARTVPTSRPHAQPPSACVSSGHLHSIHLDLPILVTVSTVGAETLSASVAMHQGHCVSWKLVQGTLEKGGSSGEGNHY